MTAPLAVGLSLGRAGFGISGLVAPGYFGRALIGREATTHGAETMARVAAARDLALGLATLHALRRSRSAAVTLLAIGTVCDVADLVIAVAGTRHLPRHRRIAFPLAAGSFAAAGSASVLLARRARSHMDTKGVTQDAAR